MINNGQCQCDYCFHVFYPDFIQSSGYPIIGSVVWKINLDMQGHHICDKCFDKIKKYDKETRDNTQFTIDDSWLRTQALIRSFPDRFTEEQKEEADAKVKATMEKRAK